ncbi:hypothetical protein HWV07_17075 [Natronomonas salina]|uniref:HalOD1 output domain-containing protein n=1 Tax=Natronomonas salina TaxID=1710540 RepID=UPI0015B58FF0|nr:HalOD1 output domain-containing protein [Natronomonas salina]QLD90660.1 hypothetical protein HWV07_17075 [Natronomonas salina]
MDEPQQEDIFYRDFDTDGLRPGVAVVEAIGRIDERDPAEMTPLWGCIDGMLEHLFSDPPAAEADMEVEFSYESFRITVSQDGTGKFVRT